MPLLEWGLLEIPPQRVMSDIIDAPSHGLDLTHGSNRHKAGGVLTYSATRSPVFPTSWRRGRKRPGRGLQKKENGFTRPATQQTWPRSQIPCLRQRLPGACGHPARFGFTAAACVLHWMQTILGYQHRPKSRQRKNQSCEGEGRETYVGSDDLPAALRPVDSEDLYPRRARAWCRGRRPPYASTPLRTLAGEVPRNGGRGQEYPGPIQGGPELYRSVLDRRWKTGATPAPAEVGKSKVGGIDLNQRRMR